MSVRRKKLGIMGGTFDPVHFGHLILAQYAYEQLELDEVLFIPSGMPPHKPNRDSGTSSVDRIEMTRLAIEDNCSFALTTIEMDNDGPCYTYATLNKLRDIYPDADFYFILGEDSLVDFPTWKNPREILAQSRIAVGARPGSSDKRIEDTIEKTRNLIGGEFVRINAPAIELSSREIRKRIEEGKRVEYMLPEKVLEYIKNRGLYKNKEQANNDL